MFRRKTDYFTNGSKHAQPNWRIRWFDVILPGWWWSESVMGKILFKSILSTSTLQVPKQKVFKIQV